MDPSEIESASITTVADAAAWAGFSNISNGEALSPLASFLGPLGFSPEAPVRQIAMYTEADWLNLVSEWRLPGDVPFCGADRASGIVGASVPSRVPGPAARVTDDTGRRAPAA